MIAPSFQSMTLLTPEPFLKNGKLYVTVRNEKTGNKRDVRWYDQKEYTRTYGKPAEISSDGKRRFKGLRQARGFSAGPVMAIVGAVAANEQWLSASVARYACDIGWHFVSTDKIPENIPSTLKGVLISWEEMRDGDDESVKAPAAIKQLIANKVKNNRDIVRFMEV